jgi:cytochrome c5
LTVLVRIAICLSFGLAVSAAGGAKLPDGDGKKIVETACTSCHTLEIVTDKQWDQAKWSDVVKTMKGRGAQIKDDDTPRVVAYLSKNFGQPDHAKELVEGICTLCHELARVKAQEFTKEEWENTIKGMISEGAPVTDEEFSQIVNYLTKNYGPREANQ